MSQKPSDDRASYLYGRDLAIDRRYRPCPEKQVNLYNQMIEEDENGSEDSGQSSPELPATVHTEESASRQSSSPPPASSGDASATATAPASAANKSASASASDAAAVVLRMRPTNATKTRDFIIERNILKHRIAPTTDSNHLPNAVPEKHFTFSSIFPENTTQALVYQTCVHDAIQNDENLTVLTYGTSGSGKTFTLLGLHSANPGIIPRAIEHIFRRYEQQVCQTPAVKLARGQVELVPDERLRVEGALRKALLQQGGAGGGAAAAAVGGQQAANGAAATEAYATHQARIQQEHSFVASPEEDLAVFIWVSFAEIYNESVYDLLATPPMSGKAGGGGGGGGATATAAGGQQQQRGGGQQHNKENRQPTAAGAGTGTSSNQHNPHRKPLTVISNDGNAFIKGLNAVHCRSARDAYDLLAAGLSSITYASTNINTNSSRSHCIFFVEVIKHRNQYEFEHITYKFCDLAGSERLKKTDNIGSRLKEAQKINNSLMVLGRCLDAVYHKQPIVPFRDSKLTVLLQAALQGREKIKMIVNMQPSVEYQDENLNVLNFASMAKQIVYKPPTEADLRKKTRNTARFSWFISHAANASSPVREKKAAAVAAAAGGAAKKQKKAKKGAAPAAEKAPAAVAADEEEEPYEQMGDTTQISLLLDENDRMKLENDYLAAANDELQQQLEELQADVAQRELEVQREMIAEHEQRTKRAEELWQRRMQHKEQTHARQMQMEIEKCEAKYERIISKQEQLIGALRQQLADLQSSASPTKRTNHQQQMDSMDLTSDDEQHEEQEQRDEEQQSADANCSRRTDEPEVDETDEDEEVGGADEAPDARPSLSASIDLTHEEEEEEAEKSVKDIELENAEDTAKSITDNQHEKDPLAEEEPPAKRPRSLACPASPDAAVE